jgi:hypothetical protein
MMTNDLNGTTDRADDPVLGAAELGFLECCREITRRHQELLPLLARAVGVAESDVFYTWAARRCQQSGRLDGTDWVYFFHGLECDVTNSADGRLLRFDFGPGGRVDTFTEWGVVQFIMTSRAPWPEFPVLQRHFARGEPPYDQYSGSFEKVSDTWDALEARGAFEPADPALVAFQARHTTRSADGSSRVHFPAGTPETTMFDCMVAQRPILSPVGIRLLESSHAARSPVP